MHHLSELEMETALGLLHYDHDDCSCSTDTLAARLRGRRHAWVDHSECNNWHVFLDRHHCDFLHGLFRRVKSETDNGQVHDCQTIHALLVLAGPPVYHSLWHDHFIDEQWRYGECCEVHKSQQIVQDGQNAAHGQDDQALQGQEEDHGQSRQCHEDWCALWKTLFLPLCLYTVQSHFCQCLDYALKFQRTRKLAESLYWEVYGCWWPFSDRKLPRWRLVSSRSLLRRYNRYNCWLRRHQSHEQHWTRLLQLSHVHWSRDFLFCNRSSWINDSGNWCWVVETARKVRLIEQNPKAIQIVWRSLSGTLSCH